MSEKLTRIRLLNQNVWSGLLDWGELTRAEMISQAREHAKLLETQARTIIEADDDDFEVCVVRGSIVQRLIRKLEQ